MAMVPQEWSIHALAVEFRIHPNVVARRLRDVPPFRSEGRNNFWRMADAAPALSGSTRQTGADSKEEAERRRMVAEAELAEIKLSERRGEVMPVAEVGEQLDRVFAAVRARIVAFPPKMAPIVMPQDPNKALAILERGSLEILAELESDIDHGADEGGAEEVLGDSEGGEEEALPPPAEAEPVKVVRRLPKTKPGSVR